MITIFIIKKISFNISLVFSRNRHKNTFNLLELNYSGMFKFSSCIHKVVEDRLVLCVSCSGEPTHTTISIVLVLNI